MRNTPLPSRAVPRRRFVTTTSSRAAAAPAQNEQTTRALSTLPFKMAFLTMRSCDIRTRVLLLNVWLEPSITEKLLNGYENANHPLRHFALHSVVPRHNINSNSTNLSHQY